MPRRLLAGVALVLMTATAAFGFTRDEVLLYVPFEGSGQPVVGGGERAFESEGDFQYAEGMVGRAISINQKGTYLRYPTQDNMQEREGTFAIWVQSLDWTLEEKINRWWVDVPGPTRFIIYHYLHSASIFYYHMDERREHPSIIRAHESWEPGQWQHLVGTWKDGRLRFFVNGERVPQEAQVELGPLGEWIYVGSNATEDAPDTNVDEFYVFSRALEDVEIKALYLRGTSEYEAKLAVPRMQTPRLDGVIADDEYQQAAGVTGFCNRVTGLLDEEQARAWLGWEGDSLYVAHKWLVPEKVRREPDLYSFGPVRKEARERDGPLARDDCIGVEAKAEDGSIRRVLVNALETIGDDRDGDPAWNSGAKAQCTLDAENWACEMAVPLADLGIRADQGGAVRLIRTHRLLREDEVAWPGPNPDSFATVALAEDGPAVQLTSLGRPWEGALDLQVANRREPAVNVSVGIDSGEVAEAAALSPTSRPLTVRRTLADTSATRLEITAAVGDTEVLALALPFTYPPMLDVDKFLYPSKDLLEIVLSTRGAASEAAATVTVTQADNDDALATVEVPAGGDVRVAEVDVKGLQPGQYRARVTIAAGDRMLGQKALDFEIREKPEWLGNTIGIIDHVPEPWAPLQYEGDSVSCWGRTIDLTGSLLPRQIVSQGEELLAAPVRLVGSVGGETVEPAAAEVSWEEQGEQVGRWSSREALGPVQVEVKGRVEYDGMMWFEVALSAQPARTVDRLWLEVPMVKRHSTLLYSGDYRTMDTGLTPSERWSCAFRPCLGMSDEERGLQWFAQSRRGWNLENKDKAIEIEPLEDANVLVANIIDTPTEIGEGRTFCFGLHPTPVRPPLPGRRMIRARGNDELTPPPNLAFWWTDYCLGCSYPLPLTERAPEAVANRHAMGQRVHAYTRLCECSVRGPWYEYFRDEWRVHPGPRKDYIPEADWGTANSVCPDSESWRDWTVWAFKQACEQAGFDGLYYDVSRPPSCANRHHGCGYLSEDGKWEPEVQLLATRELQKRLWIMMHEELGDKLISHHMSGHLYMVTQAFSDIVIDGENYTSMLKDNYYELLPLDKFRAEFMGHQWGPAATFLPEFSRAQLTQEGKELWQSPEKLPEVRHLAGMIFLHDSLPWPAYSDLTPYHTIWAAQDELGWADEVEFLPYWDNAEYLKPMGEELVASIFRRGSRALVVLFNNTDEDQQARMEFDLAALKVRAGRLVDFETNEGFALEDGVATVPIARRNFRLLLTER